MKKQKLLEGHHAGDFESEVNRLLESGWKLIGRVYTTDSIRYSHATSITEHESHFWALLELDETDKANKAS